MADEEKQKKPRAKKPAAKKAAQGTKPAKAAKATDAAEKKVGRAKGKAVDAAEAIEPIVPAAFAEARGETDAAEAATWEATAATAAKIALFKNPVRQGAIGGFFTSVGNLLYTIGFSAECHAVQIWRVLRDGGAFFGQIALLVFRWLGQHIATLARAIWRDVTAPLARFRKRRAQLRRIRARAQKRAAAGDNQVRTYFGLGMKSSMQFLLNIAGFLMPVAAVGILAFTVYSVMGMEYALAVEMNGHVLGYVADQQVVDGAKGLLRDRIRLAPNQEVSDWQLNPTYSIARAGQFTTTQQLVNNILVTNIDDSNDLVKATGLYIDGTLVAVTTEGETLRAWLDDLLANYRDPERPDAEVSFLDEVVCEPNPDDVYFVSSVQDYDDLITLLSSNVSGAKRYVVSGGESLDEIAHSHGITLEELQSRNPAYQEEEGGFIPDAGADLLVRRARPYLQVQVSYREMSVETIPYKSIEQENDSMPKGVKQTKQRGAEGTQEVWDDYFFVNGELDRTVRVDELTNVTLEPVDEIIEIGTMEIANVALPEGGYGGYYMFPVPGATGSSRGYSPGGHRGMDINAPAGTPIYAAEGGTVTTAGWHYSWGNHVIIEHPGGITTLYAHCSALYVSAGQQVSQGTVIGAVGSTGNSSGNHCHLELTVNGALSNPASFVGSPFGT